MYECCICVLYVYSLNVLGFEELSYPGFTQWFHFIFNFLIGKASGVYFTMSPCLLGRLIGLTGKRLFMTTHPCFIQTKYKIVIHYIMIKMYVIYLSKVDLRDIICWCQSCFTALWRVFYYHWMPFRQVETAKTIFFELTADDIITNARHNIMYHLINMLQVLESIDLTTLLLPQRCLANR